jgi:hypothetical protein
MELLLYFALVVGKQGLGTSVVRPRTLHVAHEVLQNLDALLATHLDMAGMRLAGLHLREILDGFGTFLACRGELQRLVDRLLHSFVAFLPVEIDPS